MIDPGESGSTNRPLEPAEPPPIDWGGLIALDTPDDALEALAAWLGPETIELVLEEGPAMRVARWRRGTSGGPGHAARALVRGTPEWRLSVRRAGGPPSRARVERVALALEAWRVARTENSRAESRLLDRTRELDLIQSLGRQAAESRTLHDLFSATVAVLHQGDDIDVAMVGYSDEGAPRLLTLLACPVEDHCLAGLAERCARLLGWRAGELPALRSSKLETYDDARPLRRELAEEDLVVLPILRREGVSANMIIVPSEPAAEQRLRLFYSAANQLSLHVDRIVTVREAEANRFRSILDSMPQAVVLADGEGTIVQCNRSAERMLEALDLPASGSLDGLLRLMRLGSAVREVLLRSSETSEVEVRLDGDRVFSVSLSRQRGGDPASNGLVLVFNDVTENRRIQRHLAQSEKMSSLGQMISGVAHELNNPLTSILGYSELLGRPAGEEKRARRTDMLQREAERCQRIVRNLLSFARRSEPARRSISLNEVVQSVGSLMGYQLRVDDIQLKAVLAPDLSPIHADRHQLQQMLVNMVTNARHAIGQLGGGGEITIETSRQADGSTLLEVADTGPGVSDEIRDKIFDPFFTTKVEGQGTGLGLALVYNIVTTHDATIDVSNGPHGGAVFRIVFPHAKKAAAGTAAVAERADSPSVRPGRILVVDDEPALARMVSEVLAEDGHRTEIANDGAHALRIVAERAFDLIIADIKMPGMSGTHLCEEIRRARPELFDRLVLTTGDTLGDAAGSARVEVLHKPFDADRLRRVVNARMRHRRPLDC